ncbi:MAG: PIN domain-containing protein [Colwellia sp.]|nr:PIN domain-containing protein [Colwellia sp.]
MSEEKIVYILDANILLNEPFAFLFFKEHDVVVSITIFEALCRSKNRRNNVMPNYKKVSVPASQTLVHNPNIFLLQFMVLISDKKLSKNNLEVNL